MVKRRRDGGEYSRSTYWRLEDAKRRRLSEEFVRYDCAAAAPGDPDDGPHHDDSASEANSSASDSDCGHSSSESWESQGSPPPSPSGSESDDGDSSQHSESSDDSSDESPDDSPEGSSSSGSEEDDEEEDPLIYAGAPITVGESVLSVLSLALAHNLSGACISDILQLVAMHCPLPNNCVNSLYKFKKYFSALKSPLVRRYYCEQCFGILNNRHAVCGHCHQRRGVTYFIEMPVVPQIRALFKRPGFYRMVRERMRNRRKIVEGNYEDIYDGTIYERYRDNRNVEPDNSISLMWYTDGVRIFKSSKSQLWPFLLTVNELPYSQRVKMDNTIIAGLWFGPKKPLPSNFLRFLRQDLNQLRRGININVPGENNVVRIRGTVISGTCDQPAKALFLNMTQYNGIFGCQVCKMETVQYGPHHFNRYFPYANQNDLRGLLRTDAETLVFARNAVQTNRYVMGVKGPSALALFVQNPVESTAIDFMHCGYLGITKFLVKAWFDPDYNGNPFSLQQFVQIVDARLKVARPADFLQRKVRSIAEHYKYWKASELKAWLLIYSLVFLEDIMGDDYFNHHKLLVFAVSLLNMDSVSPRMIELASAALSEYVNWFDHLYGIQYMTSNLHSLLHLPLMVQKFGPLWTTTCFPYENLNGVLKKFVSGTRFADLQIYTAASMFLNLSAFRSQKLVPGRKPHDFCERLANYQQKLSLTDISERLARVGKQHRLEQLPVEVERALIGQDLENATFFKFYRLYDKRKKILFTSASYTRGLMRNSSCVKFAVNAREMFGIVQSYLRVTQCNCERGCAGCNHSTYAIVKECRVRSAYRIPMLAERGRAAAGGLAGGNLTFIHTCEEVNVYRAVEVHSLLFVCNYVQVQDRHRTFIVEPLNTMEAE